jgi:hypothetical protein
MALDQYGGYLSMPVPGGATGHFRVGQLGSRWVFATPDGNAFWMRGCFFVDESGAFVNLTTKYNTGNAQAAWGVEATHRLARWGFNSLAEFASAYVLPHRANVTQHPAMLLTRPTPAALANTGGYVAAGLTPKDLLDAQAVGFLYAARSFPDVFDPQFATYVDLYMPDIVENVFWGGLATSAWCIGIAVDDADDVYGFGPGAETTSPRLHPHLGWAAACAKPTMASSTKWGKSYTDTTVYAKAELQTFLQARYASIGALNTAWGSTYSTFGTQGAGWGSGTGWLDEDGRHTTWMGSATAGTLAGASAGVIADLDDFLYVIADQYFSIVTAAMRSSAPNKLIWGPASLNGWGGLTRKQVLQAAGVSLDVLNAQISSQTVADKTLTYFGNKPVVSWEVYTANADSSQHGNPDLSEADNIAYTFSHATQASRGSYYTTRLAFLLSVPTVVGLKFWAWQDSNGEALNWGIVSLKDNTYDGVEAVVATGTNAYGFSIGGEDFNYGNFAGPVTTANSNVEAILTASLLLGASRHPVAAIVGAL